MTMRTYDEFYSVDTLAYSAIGTMTRYATRSHYSDTEPAIVDLLLLKSCFFCGFVFVFLATIGITSNINLK